MTDKNSCCCSADAAMVLACSGASNVGQLTNEVAKRLNAKGMANFFCVAGIGANIDGMVESIRATNKVLVLDGCSAQCAKKCMDRAGLSDYAHLVVTDLSIEKNHDFTLANADIDRLLSASQRTMNF